jgi:hypothetical protein
LNTRGNKGISFYEFLADISTWKKKQYVKNMLQYYRENNPQMNKMKIWYRVFSMYFGSINVFRPALAAFIYRLPIAPPPENLRILDPTMGWGGRLLGAVAVGAKSYTGIDLNKNLKPCYTKMQKYLQKNLNMNTEIQCLFTDAVQFDYSVLKYNLVLTSTPYFNIEKYSHMNTYESKEDWKQKFYIPLFENTMKYLEKGGLYCLNVPVEIYENVCVPLWGHTRRKYPLKLSSRVNQNYQEYIYVWTKN